MTIHQETRNTEFLIENYRNVDQTVVLSDGHLSEYKIPSVMVIHRKSKTETIFTFSSKSPNLGDIKLQKTAKFEN